MPVFRWSPWDFPRSYVCGLVLFLIWETFCMVFFWSFKKTYTAHWGIRKTRIKRTNANTGIGLKYASCRQKEMDRKKRTIIRSIWVNSWMNIGYNGTIRPSKSFEHWILNIVSHFISFNLQHSTSFSQNIHILWYFDASLFRLVSCLKTKSHLNRQWFSNISLFREFYRMSWLR